MSLGPLIIREPDPATVTEAEAVIYRAFIDALEHPSRTSPALAILRAAKRTGCGRRRVLEVVRKVNAEALPYHLQWSDGLLDSAPRDL